VTGYAKVDRDYYGYTDADLPPAESAGRVLIDYDLPPEDYAAAPPAPRR
jgi:hypothetical protein